MANSPRHLFFSTPKGGMSDLAIHPFLRHPGALAIAHRGGSLEAEENTMAAFAHAVALGYSHVELDVHATCDGTIVIHHDPDLTRICADPRRIAELDLPTLRGVRTRAGAQIPLLADVLNAYPRLHLTIEMKSDAVVAPLCKLLDRMQVLDRVCLGAFAPARTAAARKLLGARLLWSPAHGQVARLWARGWGLPLPLALFQVVQIPVTWKGIPVLTRRFVRAAHDAGVKVQVWTVNDRPEMERLLDLGVDGIMTDRPEALRDVLRARGQWPLAGEQQHHDSGIEQIGRHQNEDMPDRKMVAQPRPEIKRNP
ncbi:MAG: glycerophosphodiester phosphodiesterase [Rhodobacteraceae bacterium]|nr:MAG: glycerophosphodiester phosphodiesterase [Paracoccaceae bacterium]